MDRWILTAVCVAGLMLAAWMAWRWRGLERVDRPVDDLPGGWAGVRRAMRAIAVMFNSGLIAGLLVGGLGGRLFMRIMAATSDDSAQGVLTDADERVGEITFGGSFGLLVFGGIFSGLLGAIVYRLSRRWLPRRAWMAGLVVAVLSLGAFGRMSDLLDPDNKDFAILSPVPLAVGLIVVLAALFGVVLVSVHERLDRGMPDLTTWSVGLVAFAPVVLMGLSPMTAIVLVVVPVIAATGSSFVKWWVGSPRVTKVGQVLVGVAVVAAAAVIAIDSATIVA